METKARRFRSKPIEKWAIQWNGTNIEALQEFMQTTDISYNVFSGTAYIPTLEGIMSASEGDWIVRGVEGEFYPVKPSIFAKNYEEVEELSHD